MTKRSLAFKWSAETLCQTRVYMWTFTRIQADDMDVSRKAWNHLLVVLKRTIPGWSCIRVFERHPGQIGANGEERSHGLHVHAIVPKFVSWKLVRGVCRCVGGWGRCRVDLFKNDEDAIQYCSKYLSKKREPWAKGWRLWACCNVPGYTRLKDVTKTSLETMVWGWLKSFAWWERLNWSQRSFIANRSIWQVRASGVEMTPQGPSLEAVRNIRRSVSEVQTAFMEGMHQVWRKAGEKLHLGAMYFSINAHD